MAKKETPVVAPVIVMLETSKIVPNPDQPRREFSEEHLKELAASIKSNGLLQPISVRPNGEKFELIAGERRWRACRLNKMSHIPCIVSEASDKERDERAIIENIQRESLTQLEEAHAYFRLKTTHGMKQTEIAKRVGRTDAWVSQCLKLLEAEPEVQEAVLTGEITGNDAVAIARVGRDKKQEQKAKLEEVKETRKNHRQHVEESRKVRSFKKEEEQLLENGEDKEVTRWGAEEKLILKAADAIGFEGVLTVLQKICLVRYDEQKDNIHAKRASFFTKMEAAFSKIK